MTEENHFKLQHSAYSNNNHDSIIYYLCAMSTATTTVIGKSAVFNLAFARIFCQIFLK